jgi:hypothetical protein
MSVVGSKPIVLRMSLTVAQVSGVTSAAASGANGAFVYRPAGA